MQSLTAKMTLKAAKDIADKRNLEKELARLERAIEKAKSEGAALNEKFAQADQSDFELLSKLMTSQRENQDLLDSLEEQWLTTSEKLEG